MVVARYQMRILKTDANMPEWPIDPSGLTNIQLEVSEKIQLPADQSTYTPLPFIDQISLYVSLLKLQKRIINP